MSMLAFFPWLTLEQDVSLPGFSLVRFDRGRHPGGEVQPTLDAVLELFVVGNNRPVSSATLLQLEGHQLTNDLTPEEQAEVFLLAELVAFSGLAARHYFAPFFYANRDTFTFLTQGFTDPSAGVLVRTRRRDGGSTAFKTPGAARVRWPDHAAGIGGAKLDTPLLASLLQAREWQDWSDFEEAIFFFNRANTDSDQVFEQAEVVATTSAFERVLGCRAGREGDLAERFAAHWQPRHCLLPAACPRLPRGQTQYTSRSIAESWIRDLFRLRGNVGHGRRRTAHPALWSDEEHLLLGAFAFPLLVKQILHGKGVYAPTWQDVTDVDIFEELATSRLFDQVLEEQEDEGETGGTDDERPLAWPWNIIRGEAQLRRIEEALAADFDAAHAAPEVRTDDGSSITPGSMQDRIVRRLPWSGPSLQAATRAVALLPEHLLSETLTKLATGGALGTAHELRLLGELIGAGGEGFACEPFPNSATCDALLTVCGQPIGLEIAAHVAPAFSVAVGRASRTIEAWLAERFPGRAFEIRIDNLESEFPLDEDGRLQESTLVGAVTREAEAWIAHLEAGTGAPAPHRNRGFISSCTSAPSNRVRQSGFSMPSLSVSGQLERIVNQKLSRPQWPADVPGVLALILHHHPVPGLLTQYRIAESAFSREPTLAAMIEVPMVLSEKPSLLVRPDGAALSEEIVARLRLALDFSYQRVGDNWPE